MNLRRWAHLWRQIQLLPPPHAESPWTRIQTIVCVGGAATYLFEFVHRMGACFLGVPLHRSVFSRVSSESSWRHKGRSCGVVLSFLESRLCRRGDISVVPEQLCFRSNCGIGGAEQLYRRRK